VVERTFSWLGHNRRMSKDYERLCASAEAFSVRLRGHDLTDGEASGSCLRLSRQFRNKNSRKFVVTIPARKAPVQAARSRIQAA
jgi:hypothetical protein